ncbi:MAG TPA: DUF2064 domain-containing protein [Longimicrobiales bacterium]
MGSDRLLVFARWPAAEIAKTQLTPSLPPDEAVSVYEACLRDVLALAARERARVELWYEVEGRAREYFEAQFAHLPRAAQVPGGIGERLHDAFAWSFADDAGRTVIVASDSPTIPDGILTAAFADLREVDIVLGPTRTGRPYLLGLRAASWPRAAGLLRRVAWGVPAAVRETIEGAEAEGLTLRMLPGWYGIERPEDLVRAREDARPESHLARWLDSESGRRYVGRVGGSADR